MAKTQGEVSEVLKIYHKRCWIDGELVEQRVRTLERKAQYFKSLGYDIGEFGEYVNRYNAHFERLKRNGI